MRIYIKKLDDKTFMVLKETTFQSILSDVLTIFVLIVAFACDIAFSLLVTHSFLFDLLVFAMIILYMSASLKNRKKEFTKEELIEKINKL